MTPALLFVHPIIFFCMAMAAWVSRGKPSHAALDGAIAAGVLFFWVLLFRAYTDRIRGEGRAFQATRDAQIARGETP